MILHFDRKRFEFHESKVGSGAATDVQELLRQTVGVDHGFKERKGFNDLYFYQRICAPRASKWNWTLSESITTARFALE